MNPEAPEDSVTLLPAVFVGGRAIALEVEVVGAWVDGTYVSVGQLRNPKDGEDQAVAEAAHAVVRQVCDAVVAARNAQEGTA
jgi:hypothetical protein